MNIDFWDMVFEKLTGMEFVQVPYETVKNSCRREGQKKKRAEEEKGMIATLCKTFFSAII